MYGATRKVSELASRKNAAANTTTRGAKLFLVVTLAALCGHLIWALIATLV
jgi:hypothetical protein